MNYTEITAKHTVVLYDFTNTVAKNIYTIDIYKDQFIYIHTHTTNTACALSAEIRETTVN